MLNADTNSLSSGERQFLSALIAALVLLFILFVLPPIDHGVAERHLEAADFDAIELVDTYNSGRCLKSRSTYAFDAIDPKGHHVVGYICVGLFWSPVIHVTDELDAKR